MPVRALPQQNMRFGSRENYLLTAPPPSCPPPGGSMSVGMRKSVEDISFSTAFLQGLHTYFIGLLSLSGGKKWCVSASRLPCENSHGDSSVAGLALVRELRLGIWAQFLGRRLKGNLGNLVESLFVVSLVCVLLSRISLSQESGFF